MTTADLPKLTQKGTSMHTLNGSKLLPSRIGLCLAWRAWSAAEPYLRGPRQILRLTTFCLIVLLTAFERIQAVDFFPTNAHELRVAIANADDEDVIWLPQAGIFQFDTIYDDLGNFMGPTATPLITKKIYIEANGARIERAGNGPRMRAFAIGEGGDLILRNAHIRGFRVKGGDGATGGGGGMGAGGAIYVYRGRLTIESCAFEANGAVAGNGSSGSSGGGGGLGGNGGPGVEETFWGGGGGGGARGNGARGFVSAGGGGGTLTDGTNALGGFMHGGMGGDEFGPF